MPVIPQWAIDTAEWISNSLPIGFGLTGDQKQAIAARITRDATQAYVNCDEPFHTTVERTQPTNKIRNVTDAIEAFIQAKIAREKSDKYSCTALDVAETRGHLCDKLAELIK